MNKLSYEKSFERLIRNIKVEQKGKVVGVFAPRKEMKPTHFYITTGDTIVPSNSEVMLYIKIGDSIEKNKLDNNISIFRNDSLLKKTWIYKIPQKYREDTRFPKEWKDKWLDATIKK
ncbi:hypothetical protein LCI24_06210 [Tenacibaculum sp. LAR 2:5]|uniref:Uncharacterized protein n=2 Tax=Tenacibaculum larymnensis TaxID=2878201 RepID=A0A9X4ENI9_9FLAO|nr:hypothetical protein [Tenacibaculum larymnensis]